MSELFNPYREWLGLSATSRPNHYELLGLPTCEPDGKKISLAADQAATKVRSFRPGTHAADWARLLDEILSAKLALLNPEHKAKYDQQFANGAATGSTSSGGNRPQPIVSTTQAGIRAFDDLYPPGFASPGVKPETQPASDTASPPAPAPETTAPVAPTLGPPASQVTAAPIVPEAMMPMAAMPAPAYSYPVATQLGASYPPGYGAPSTQPATTPGMLPPGYTAVLPQASVPAAVPSPAAFYPAGGYMPQTYLTAVATPYPTAAPIDPMAPVSIPGISAAVPQSTYPSAMPISVAAAMPLAMPVATALAAPVQAAAPAPVPQTVDAGPQVRKASAASVIMAARKDRQTRHAALLAGAAAGLVVVAGLAAYAVIQSRFGKPESDKQVAQADHTQQAGAKIDKSKSGVKVLRPTTGNLGSTDSAHSNTDTAKVEPMPDPALPDTVPMPMPVAETKPEPPPPMPMPSPEPKPEPAPTPVVKPTRQQVVELEAALKRARIALSEHSFDEAEEEATKAEKVALLAEHQALVERLRLAIDHVKLFRQALSEATSKLEAAETIKVGSSTIVAIVETFPDKITVRINGMNRHYSFVNIPPGLAVAILDTKRIGGQPDSRVLKAMFVATGKNADAEVVSEARGWLQQVEASDPNAAALLTFLDDSYDGLVKAFDESEKKSAANTKPAAGAN